MRPPNITYSPLLPGWGLRPPGKDDSQHASIHISDYVEMLSGNAGSIVRETKSPGPALLDVPPGSPEGSWARRCRGDWIPWGPELAREGCVP